MIGVFFANLPQWKGNPKQSQGMQCLGRPDHTRNWFFRAWIVMYVIIVGYFSFCPKKKNENK